MAGLWDDVRMHRSFHALMNVGRVNYSNPLELIARVRRLEAENAELRARLELLFEFGETTEGGDW